MFDERIERVIDEVDALRNRVSDHWQVPRDEARLLAQLVRIGGCRSVCEIGVSYGFSLLHLGAAVASNGGHAHGFDIDPKKVEAATRHVEQAGLSGVVTLHLGDARERVSEVEPQSPYDFVFIDATKEQSGGYLRAVLPRLAPRAVLVTDNTATHWGQLESFVASLRDLAGGWSCSVPVGNGFELTILDRPRG